MTTSHDNQEYTRNLGVCVSKNVRVTTGVLPSKPRVRVTILYYIIENTVTSTVNDTYARCMMGRLSLQQIFCIVIGCILYGMV